MLKAIAFRQGYNAALMPPTKNLLSTVYFMSAESLRDIKLGASVESIGDFAFYGCDPVELVLPSKLKSIGQYAFDVSSLTSVVSGNPEPPVCKSGAFSSAAQSKAVLTVPQGRLDAYKAADVWKDFTTVNESDMSGIGSMPVSEISVEIRGGEIFVSGLGATDRVEIYNVGGACVYAGTETHIAAFPRGIYLVRVGGCIRKVML